MASFTTGYYVPTSMSQSYVASKRNEEGTLKYKSAEQELGIQKQMALQNLEKNYETTIENAYASYLANQRGINTSAMGQGYKEIYKQAQEQQLLSDIAVANMNLANTRSEISANIAEAQKNIQAQEAQEVSNLNRVQGAMTQYLQYVKSLTGAGGKTALSAEDAKKEIDDLYETLFELSPKTLTDESGAQGLGFVDWIKTQLTGSEVDTAWGDWLFSGGLADFKTAVAKTRINTNKPAEKPTEKPTEKKPYNDKATNNTVDNNKSSDNKSGDSKPRRFGKSMLI